MPVDPSKVPSWLLNLLDPGRDKRAVLKFERSGDIRFNVNEVITSLKDRGELDRIGQMEQKLRSNEIKKTRAG